MAAYHKSGRATFVQCFYFERYKNLLRTFSVLASTEVRLSEKAFIWHVPFGGRLTPKRLKNEFENKNEFGLHFATKVVSHSVSCELSVRDYLLSESKKGCEVYFRL